MLNDQSLTSLLASGNLEELRRETDATTLLIALNCFHNVLIRDRRLNDLSPAQRLEILERKDRLAGVLLVVTVPQMPTWPAFGPLVLSQGAATNDYDVARAFIVQKKTQSTETPVPGPFYPEVMYERPIERLLALGNAHIRCPPDSSKQISLFSLRGRLTASAAQSATQPHGTTCALFLRALLVAAGDGRFVESPKKLMIRTPHLGHMAYGIGADYESGATSGKGVKVVGRADGSPTAIKRGDLYYISAAEGDWQESGHVGLVENVEALGNRVKLHTIDGGQQNPGAEQLGGKGWWTTKNDRSFEGSGSTWTGAKIRVTNSKTNAVEQRERKLIVWISLQEIEGMFERHVLMVGNRIVQTTL